MAQLYEDIRRRGMAIGRVRKISRYKSISFWLIVAWIEAYEKGGGTLEEVAKMSAEKVIGLFGVWLEEQALKGAGIR